MSEVNVSQLGAVEPDEGQFPLLEADEHEVRGLPVVPAGSSFGQVTGEVRSEDLKRPYLKIIHGLSQDSDKFSQGALVLNKQYQLVKPGEPLQFLLPNVTLYWRESVSDVDRRNGQIARSFLTVEEVRKAGGTTDWPSGAPKPANLYQRGAALDMLVLKPQGLVCGAFNIALPEERFAAPATMLVEKSAYRYSAKELLSIANLSLSGQFTRGLWSVTVEKRKAGDYEVWSPIVRLQAILSTELHTAFAGLMAPGKAARTE